MDHARSDGGRGIKSCLTVGHGKDNSSRVGVNHLNDVELHCVCVCMWVCHGMVADPEK